MKHRVAGLQNSCVFRFRRSHVHTRLLYSGVKTNSRASRHLSLEEWVWNGFQDTCLSVVECQTQSCDISQDCTYTQHAERFSEHFHSSNVAPKVIPLGEQRIYQWDVKISSKSLARLCVMNVSCCGTIVGKRKFTLILSWNFLNCFCIVLRCNWRPR